MVSFLFSRDTFRIPVGEDIGEGCVRGAWWVPGNILVNEGTPAVGVSFEDLESCF